MWRIDIDQEICEYRKKPGLMIIEEGAREGKITPIRCENPEHRAYREIDIPEGTKAIVYSKKDSEVYEGGSVLVLYGECRPEVCPKIGFGSFDIIDSNLSKG